MSKRMKITALAVLLALSLVLSFGAGCALGDFGPVSSVVTRISPDAQLGLDTVDQAWQIIFQKYVEKDQIDASLLSEAAIRGMVEALDDPYTSYLRPRVLEMSQSGLAGKYEGIGAWVELKDDRITIIAPMPGSPAEKAGIRSGDAILEIDGVSTSGMGLEEAVTHIKGPKGTTVRLLVLHEGESEPVGIEVIRDEIKMTSVFLEMKGDIAYINIHTFSERTDGELIPVLQQLKQEGATGIILDLRNNPGGLLETVVDVASHFIKEGVVVSVRYTDGTQTSSAVGATSVTTDLPMVVLVNSFSASGSEVLAGALQDYGRAIVSGNTTFGKGSVNQLHELKDGSGLYITIARWLTPQGRMIEGKGITPDYKLELEGDDAIQWAIDYLKGSR